jgi:3-deoxy-7-phosphoheptulonate synthase
MTTLTTTVARPTAPTLMPAAAAGAPAGEAMLVLLSPQASEADICSLQARLSTYQVHGHLRRSPQRTVLGVVGTNIPAHLPDELAACPGVAAIEPLPGPHKLSGRTFQPADSTVEVRGIPVGGGQPCVVMAGPCAVENEAQIMTSAHALRRAGATMLRGGAFKPRSSPYSFRGLGEAGLQLLAQARAETGLPIVTEVITPDDVDLVARYADLLQIGARNMQNYVLLEEVGRSGMPVLLKRGLSATIEEWLLCAEYILAQGNPNVILCERGIRTFETATRNTLDLNAVAVARDLSHLPIIADPSHGTGKAALVPPLALAAIAAGADGLIIEAHPDPARAASDGSQSLTLEALAELLPRLGAVAAAVDRRMA